MILLGLLTAMVVMFATGLALRAGDFTRLADMRGPGLYGLALQVIGLPVAAMLIGQGLGIAPYDGMGLMALALAPASPASHVLVGLAGGHIGLSRMLTAWSTVIWLPVMLLTGLLAAIPGLWVVALLGMALPMLAGLWMGARDRVRAARLEKRCTLVGSALTGLLMVLVLLRHAPLLSLPLVLTVLSLALAAMVAGLLAQAFGRDAALTLGIALPMQNLALPLAVAGITDVGLPTALYGMAMYLAAFAVLLLSRR